jgi:hypothetical protein
MEKTLLMQMTMQRRRVDSGARPTVAQQRPSARNLVELRVCVDGRGDR